MGTNTGSNTHKALRVGSTVISRAFLGTQKVFDQLDYPTLDLNFALTKSLDSKITFTRASSGTYFDSSGVIQTATTNTPRFDHNPVTGESLGLLIEEQRTNLLLNSATLSTQSVTVTNVAHTLSFYGTGTIILSGVHSATVNGAGAFPTRTTLTFTPTAGTLTLTSSGTVQYAQLGPGSFATSWIPTTGASATRAADNVTITGTNFSSWYNQSEGTFSVSGRLGNLGTSNSILRTFYRIDDGTDNNRIMLRNGGSGSLDYRVITSGVQQANLEGGNTISANSLIKHAGAYKLNSFASALNGGNLLTDNLASVPTVNQIYLGFSLGDTNICGTIRRLAYYNRRLANAELQLLTA